MKEKTIIIKVDGAAQGQWSNLLLELNLIKKAWRPFGVDMTLKAPGLKRIIEWGNRTGELDQLDKKIKKLANGPHTIKR